jgi:predicted ATPase/DNA-binding CsgD family transcriptional regulator
MTAKTTPTTPDPDDGTWIVGRDGQLRRLRAAVRDAAAGAGAALVIEGDAGSGKTALLAAVAREARLCGLLVLSGAADELGRDVPLLALRECLAAADGKVGTEPEELAAFVRRLCADTPLLLALDDLQWADEASLLVWRRLSALAPGLPLLLVGARQSTSPGAPDPAVLRLGPLSAQETDRLIRHLVGAPAGPRLAELIRSVDGNARMLRELVPALADEGSLAIADGIADVPAGVGLPARLLATAAARLADLPSDTRGVLRLAALLGSRFGVADLAALTGRDLSGLVPLLDGLAARGILADAGGSHLRFRTPLLQQALYADIPEAMRTVLHHRVAQILAQQDAAPERVARHLLDTAEPAEGWALEWLTEHARLLTQRVPAIAGELFERTLERAPNSQLSVAVLWKYMCASANRIGRSDALDIALRFKSLATDADYQVFADMILSVILLRLGRFEDAVGIADQGIEQYASEATATCKRRRTRFFGLRARILCYQGRYAEAEELAVDVLERGQRLGDPTAVICAYHVIARVRLARRDHTGALAAVEAGLAEARDAPRLASDLEVEFAAARALLLGDLDRGAEAAKELDRARTLGRRTQAQSSLGFVQAVAAALHYAAGRWGEALDELAAFAEDATPDGWLPSQTQALAALILAQRGRDDEADDRLARVAQPIPAGSPQSRSVHLLMARALRAEADGRAADALAVLATALEPDVARDLEQRYLLLPDVVRLALALGDGARATAAANAAETEARAVPTALARAAAAQRCRGLIARDPGPLIQALEYYKRVQRPLELARTWEDLAAVTAAHGDTESARGQLNQAVDIYAGLGAEGELARADARLRVLGVRRGRRRAGSRSGDGWDSLTPTEVKIAGLVAKGRSNREIAASLSLSPRTVQTHVSHILVKLGAGSRSQIAREAAMHLLPAAPADPGSVGGAAGAG